MKARRKSTLAAIAAGAIALAAGCTTTQEIDQTMPPYASISDEARDPASAPTAAQSPGSGSSGGAMSAIGAALIYPFHLIGEAFSSSSNSASN